MGRFRKLVFTHKPVLVALLVIVILVVLIVRSVIYALDVKGQAEILSSDKQGLLLDKQGLLNEIETLDASVSSSLKLYEGLRNEDQYKINQGLKADIKKTHDAYTNSIGAYEGMLELQAKKQDISKFSILYAAIVKDLSDLNFASAESTLSDLNSQIKKIKDDLAAKEAALRAAGAPAGPAPENNSAPGSGFSYQSVKTDIGSYTLSIVAADLGSTALWSGGYKAGPGRNIPNAILFVRR